MSANMKVTYLRVVRGLLVSSSVISAHFYPILSNVVVKMTLTYPSPLQRSHLWLILHQLTKMLLFPANNTEHKHLNHQTFGELLIIHLVFLSRMQPPFVDNTSKLILEVLMDWYKRITVSGMVSSICFPYLPFAFAVYLHVCLGIFYQRCLFSILGS